ncbi:MAG: hypothetical protein PHS66_02775 [Candidatus Omnitrophica bacterium]|nr:hypothetical protein [Candidatus Omnitrophota bacterium]
MKKTKARYEKPKLARVKLIAEEAVLTGCQKPSSGNGPSTPSCTCSSSICSTASG